MNEKLSQRLFVPSFALAGLSACFIAVCGTAVVVEASKMFFWLFERDAGVYGILGALFFAFICLLWCAMALSFRELLRISWRFMKFGRSGICDRWGSFWSALFGGAAPFALLAIIALGTLGLSTGIDMRIHSALKISTVSILPAICHLAVELILGRMNSDFA